MNTCPRDQQILASNDVNGYRYYACEHCGGSWIPGAALDRVLSDQGIVKLKSVRPTSVGDLFCPDCHDLCEPVVIQECRLDLCPRCHGVWLDAGEAEKVRLLFPDDSAVVDADKDRSKSRNNQTPLVAASAADLVGNLLLTLWK